MHINNRGNASHGSALEPLALRMAINVVPDKFGPLQISKVYHHDYFYLFTDIQKNIVY